MLEVFHVTSNVQLGPQFSTRSLCNTQKPVKLDRSPTLKTFGKVRHDRNRCPPDLLTQAKVLRESADRSDVIDLSGQRTSLLPSNQVFKLPHSMITHHSLLVAHHSKFHRQIRPQKVI